MFGHQLVQWTLLAITAATSQPAPQEQWEQVREQIRRKVAAVASFRLETLTTMPVVGDPTAELSIHCMTEAARRPDNAWLWRTETRMKTAALGAEDNATVSPAILIHDGRHTYAIAAGSDEKVARLDPSAQDEAVPPEDILPRFEQAYDLRLVGEQDLEGRRTWVVDGRMRSTPRQGLPFPRVRIFFDQATGLAVRTAGYVGADEPVAVSRTLRLQANIDIPAGRFALPRDVGILGRVVQPVAGELGKPAAIPTTRPADLSAQPVLQLRLDWSNWFGYTLDGRHKYGSAGLAGSLLTQHAGNVVLQIQPEPVAKPSYVVYQVESKVHSPSDLVEVRVLPRWNDQPQTPVLVRTRVPMELRIDGLSGETLRDLDSGRTMEPPHVLQPGTHRLAVVQP